MCALVVGEPMIPANTTLTSYVAQLSRVTPREAKALYVRDQALFHARPDLFATVTKSLPWECALAVLGGAYYVQPIPVEAFGEAVRSVLRGQRDGAAGASWRHAFNVLAIARQEHGNRVPGSLYANAARSCVQDHAWVPALNLVRHAEGVGMSSKMLLLNASRATSVKAAWSSSLALLVASETVTSQDPKVAQSVRVALMRAMGSAPWRQALRLARSAAVKKAVGGRGARALLAGTLPWHVALGVLGPKLSAQEVTVIAGGMPAGASTVLFRRESNPALLPVTLAKACERHDWASAVEAFEQAARVGSSLKRGSVDSTILLLHRAARHGEVVSVASHELKAAVAMTPKALCAALDSSANVVPPAWDVALSLAVVAGRGKAPRDRLHPRTLSQLLRVLAVANRPTEALRLLGYARRECGIELRDQERLDALLFCQRYGRWKEALAILRKLEGERPAQAARIAPLAHCSMVHAGCPSETAESVATGLGARVWI